MSLNSLQGTSVSSPTIDQTIEMGSATDLYVQLSSSSTWQYSMSSSGPWTDLSSNVAVFAPDADSQITLHVTNESGGTQRINVIGLQDGGRKDYHHQYANNAGYGYYLTGLSTTSYSQFVVSSGSPGGDPTFYIKRQGGK